MVLETFLHCLQTLCRIPCRCVLVDALSLPSDCNEEYIFWMEVIRNERDFFPTCTCLLQTRVNTTAINLITTRIRRRRGFSLSLREQTLLRLLALLLLAIRVRVGIRVRRGLSLLRLLRNLLLALFRLLLFGRRVRVRRLFLLGLLLGLLFLRGRIRIG